MIYVLLISANIITQTLEAFCIKTKNVQWPQMRLLKGQLVSSSMDTFLIDLDLMTGIFLTSGR